MTPNHLKAARALIGWDQHKLAEEAAISVGTVRRIEGGYLCSLRTIERIRLAFHRADVILFDPDRVGGEGVRLGPAAQQIMVPSKP